MVTACDDLRQLLLVPLCLLVGLYAAVVCTSSPTGWVVYAIVTRPNGAHTTLAI